MANNDGTIRIGTEVDESGLRTGLQNSASSTRKTFEELAKESGKTVEELKADAKRIAEEYQRQGYNIPNSYKKAYADMGVYSDRTTSQMRQDADEAGQSHEKNADKAKKTWKEAFNGIGDFAKQGFGVLKSAAETAVKAITGVSAAIGTVTAASVKVGSSFEAEMSKVASISGSTSEELAALTDKAKEMGAKTKFSASESAEAMEYMAMAGWKTGAMLEGIEGIMNLAAASGEDLATTSDIVTDALTAFGTTAQDITQTKVNEFVDVLAAASSNANTNVSMMGETFKYVAPVAGALGYSAEDTAVAIGLMANSGIKASQAGTALRSMMSRLAKPTDEVEAAMERLGISLTNSDGSMKSLNEMMNDLRTGFSGLSEAEQAQEAAALAGQEAMSGLLAIVNASDEDFNKLNDAIYNCDGTAQQMADTMQNNLQGQITILKSAAEGLGIEIYDSIQQPLSGIAQIGIDSVNKLSEAFKTGGTSGLIEAGMQVLNDLLMGIAEAAPNVIAMATDVIREFVNGFDSNIPQIMSAGASILNSLVVGVIEMFPSLATLAFDLVSNILTGITDNSGSIVQSGANVLVDFINGCTSMLPQLLQMAVDAIISMAMAITEPDTLSNIINAGIDLILSLISGIVDAFPKLAATAPQIIVNLATALIKCTPKLLEAAITIVSELGRLMLSSVASLLSFIPRIFTEIVNEFRNMDWGSIGSNIIEGIKSGITGAAGRLVDSAKNAAKSALNGMKSLLGIHSPSRVCRDVIGKNMIAGINVGMEEETPELEKQSETTAQQAVNSMKKVSASEFVGSMQQKAYQIQNDAAERQAVVWNDVYSGNSAEKSEEIDYERMGEEMSKAMDGMTVNIDGQPAGKIVAPYVSKEIANDIRRKK